MKRLTNVVLMLCIAMMCTTPFEAQGQNRRTGGTSNTTKKEQSAQTKSAKSSEPKTKMVTPSGQTRKQNNTAPAQVQDRRSTNTGTQGNHNSHSAQVSRKNSDVNRKNSDVGRKDNNVGRQNAPSGNRDAKPADKNKNHNNKPNYDRDRGHKPNAVQYHNQPPRPRGPEYTRPYLEPKHKPMPSYRYGDHFFGHRIKVLPHGYVTMRIGGRDYYYYNGIYYRRYLLGGYYVCRPPRGTEIASTMFNVALTAIAINTIRDEIQRARRAAALSTVYSNKNTGYVVRTSDDYYNTNLVNQAGQEYYYQDGVFYILKNGQYYVIEAPIGALVTEIPADYDEVELDGRTYYQVEDTLYKATVIDGALYFEVVCNL